MATQFRVEKVHGQEPWTSTYGDMLSWQLSVRNLSNDQVGFAKVNSKPTSKPYEPGQTFWAETKGERNGVAELKRVQPPGAGGFPGKPAPQGRQHPPTQATLPYDRAVKLFKRIAEDFEEHTHATTIFLAVLKGQVAEPTIEEPEDAGAGPAPSWPAGPDEDIPF